MVWASPVSSPKGITYLSHLFLISCFPFRSLGHFSLTLCTHPSSYPPPLCLTSSPLLESGRTKTEWIHTCISCCLLWWPGVFLLLESSFKSYIPSQAFVDERIHLPCSVFPLGVLQAFLVLSWPWCPSHACLMEGQERFVSCMSTRLNSPTRGFSHIFIPRFLASSLLFSVFLTLLFTLQIRYLLIYPEETSPYLAIGGWEIRTHTGGTPGDTN